MTIDLPPAQVGEYDRAKTPALQDWSAALAAVEAAYPREPIEPPIAPMARTFTADGVRSSLFVALEAAGLNGTDRVRGLCQTLKGHGIEAICDVLALGKERFTKIRNSAGRLAVKEVMGIIAAQVPDRHWHKQPPMTEVAQLYNRLDEMPIGVVVADYAMPGLSVDQVISETSHRLAMFWTNSPTYGDPELNAVVRTQYLARDFATKFDAAKRHQLNI